MAFVARHPIRFDEVDAAGFVYYPRLFDLCHQTFEDLFAREGPATYADFIVGRRMGFPSVAAQATFSVPFVYGDVALIALTVSKIGESSVTCRYELSRERDQTKASVIEVTCVHTDLVERRARPLSAELRELFGKHLVPRGAADP